jgi:HAD superfamily hydrolase (TIGR01509 family)
VLSAVVFDLDGVLLDSESKWDAARRAVVAGAGGRWRASATAEMIGMSAPEWSGYLHDELAVPLAPPQISDRVVAELLAEYRRGLPLLPGAPAAVHRLAERWPLGLASSANRSVIDAVLELAGLESSFTATVSSEEVPHGKPSPDVYLAVCRALGVQPSAAAAVEDSGNGIRSAAAAAMAVVAIPNREFPPDPDALALADVTLGGIDELTPAVVLDASSRAGRRARTL